MQLVREHSTQSSQFGEPPLTDSGLKSGNSVHDLISTKNKQKTQVGNVERSPEILEHEEESH